MGPLWARSSPVVSPFPVACVPRLASRSRSRSRSWYLWSSNTHLRRLRAGHEVCLDGVVVARLEQLLERRHLVQTRRLGDGLLNQSDLKGEREVFVLLSDLMMKTICAKLESGSERERHINGYRLDASEMASLIRRIYRGDFRDLGSRKFSGLGVSQIWGKG